MNTQRSARPEIAQMDGTQALPRKSGELVFHDEWERRAFAMAVSLAEQGLFEWRDFQRELIKAVAKAEGAVHLVPSRSYYESWLAALEAVLSERQLSPVRRPA
ncbi:MAG: nitrile hydratase accessory protein [Pseudomonadota bacterium]